MSDDERLPAFCDRCDVELWHVPLDADACEPLLCESCVDELSRER